MHSHVFAGRSDGPSMGLSNWLCDLVRGPHYFLFRRTDDRGCSRHSALDSTTEEATAWRPSAGASVPVDRLLLMLLVSSSFLRPWLVCQGCIGCSLLRFLRPFIVDRPGLYGSDLTIGRFALLYSFVFSWFVWPGAFTAGF